MNIALCFCVRNCEPYLINIFKNIYRLKSSLENIDINIKVFSIFVYDNCNDKSKQLLEIYQKRNNNIIVRTISNPSNHRTERIANARNTCLNIVYNELNNIQYHFVIDADDICSNKWNINIIIKYLYNFDNDNWDCISFNRDNYYDIWALMFDDFKHHCFGYGDSSSKVINIMKNCIVNKIRESETNSIEVLSAFNGFAIYKTDKFKGLHYDGLYSNFKHLITDEERVKSILALKKLGLNANICNKVECCEHLFYNISALHLFSFKTPIFI